MLGDHLIPALSPFGRVRFQLIRAVSQGERALAKKRHAREEGFQHGDLVAAPVWYCWYRKTYAVSCSSHIGPWSIRPARHASCRLNLHALMPTNTLASAISASTFG